jgi:hypothetical protein
MPNETPSDHRPTEGRNGHAPSDGHTPPHSLLTAGDMIAEAITNEKDGVVGSFVARDEPPEYGYDQVVADRRAVNTLKRVLAEEGQTLDPQFEPGGVEMTPTAFGDVAPIRQQRKQSRKSRFGASLRVLFSRPHAIRRPRRSRTSS